MSGFIYITPVKGDDVNEGRPQQWPDKSVIPEGWVRMLDVGDMPHLGEGPTFSGYTTEPAGYFLDVTASVGREKELV